MADPLLLADVQPTRLVHSAAPPVELVGRSAAVARLHDLLRRAAPLATGALLVAERGIEADGVAREMHVRGRGTSAPFVAVDCLAADPGAIDHELFGAPVSPDDVESVAPSSAVAAARGGTLFLHDIAELPASAQARLARLARDAEASVGGTRVALYVRLIASAPPTVDGDVREHRLRADLYRRLAASRIDLPTLRDRPEDVAAIAERLVAEMSAARHVPERTLTQAALALLAALTWPGNLAELRAVIERVVVESPDETIHVEDLLPALQLNRAPAAFVPSGSLRDARLRFERDYIAAVLQHHAWRIADAAQTLGIQRPNLYRKARQLGIPLTRVPEPR